MTTSAVARTPVAKWTKSSWSCRSGVIHVFSIMKSIKASMSASSFWILVCCKSGRFGLEPPKPLISFSCRKKHASELSCQVDFCEASMFKAETLGPPWSLCIFINSSSIVWSTGILPNGLLDAICTENSPFMKCSYTSG